MIRLPGREGLPPLRHLLSPLGPYFSQPNTSMNTLDLPIVELEESGVVLSGIYPDLDINEYHSSRALSNSGAGRLLKSPAHYKIPFGKASAAMNLGSAVHTLLLEPELNQVQRAPDGDRRTKAGKEAYNEFVASVRSCDIILKGQDYERAQRMVEAVRSHEGVRRAGLLEGVAEQSFFGMDESGCYRRARTDLWKKDARIVVDLKTCIDASEHGFRKAVAEYGYYRQHPWYTDTMELCGEPQNDFVFLCVENVEPFNVAVYGLCEATVEQGRRENKRAAELWAKCTERGEWPGYDLGVGMISLPGWKRDIDFDL